MKKHLIRYNISFCGARKTAAVGGLQTAYWFDTPTGPTIVSLAAALFALAGLTANARRLLWRAMASRAGG